MAKLIYSAIASADGYVEDADGGIDWGTPDEELLRFINELERPASTYLYGRRMYEAMVYWETADTSGQPSLFQEFTDIWQAAEKIVFSKTLTSVSSLKTRIEPTFEPVIVRQLKSEAEQEMRVGGAELAGQGRQGGAGRRGTALLSSCRRRRWQASTSRWRPLRSGAAGYATVRTRCCLPEVQPSVSLITCRPKLTARADAGMERESMSDLVDMLDCTTSAIERLLAELEKEFAQLRVPSGR